MKRFTCVALLLCGLFAVPCHAQKNLDSRKALCVATVPSDWAGTANRSSHPDKGKATISFLRAFDSSRFAKLKESLLASYEPAKVLENSDHRLWFEYTSAATATNFDRHWLVIVPGARDTCILNLHFTENAEPVVRKIAESLRQMDDPRP